MTPNPGYDAGIAKRNKKERLAWALKGAPLRKKDLALNSMSAIAEARKLRDSITDKMQPEIDPEEAIVSVVFATQDLSALITKMPKLDVKPNPKKDLELAAKFAEYTPIGFLIFVWDKEDQTIFGHARPLIVEDSRSIEMNAKALSLLERQIRRVVLGEGVN